MTQQLYRLVGVGASGTAFASTADGVALLGPVGPAVTGRPGAALWRRLQCGPNLLQLHDPTFQLSAPLCSCAVSYEEALKHVIRERIAAIGVQLVSQPYDHVVLHQLGRHLDEAVEHVVAVAVKGGTNLQHFKLLRALLRSLPSKLQEGYWQPSRYRGDAGSELILIAD